MIMDEIFTIKEKKLVYTLLNIYEGNLTNSKKSTRIQEIEKILLEE